MNKRIGLSLEENDETLGEAMHPDEVGDFTEELVETAALEEMTESVINELNEVVRTEDTIDGLIDTRQVINSTEQPTPTEVNLLQISANMAAAGTDIDATQLMPITEGITDYKELSIQLEQRINTALESLGTSHLSIWQRFKLVWQNYWNYFKKIKNKLAEVKKAVEVIRRDKPDSLFSATIKDKSGVFQVTNKKPVTSFKELGDTLFEAADVFEEFVDNTRSGIKMFNLAEIGILTQMFKKEEAEKALSHSFINYRDIFFTEFTKLKYTEEKVSGQIKRYVVELPIANTGFAFTMPEQSLYDDQNVDSIFSVLSSFQHEGRITFTPNHVISDSVEFSGASYQDVEKYIEGLEKIVSVVLILLNDNTYWRKVEAFQSELTSQQLRSSSPALNLAMHVGQLLYKNSNRYHRLKTKQIQTVLRLAGSTWGTADRLLNANFVLINKLVKARNWK